MLLQFSPNGIAFVDNIAKPLGFKNLDNLKTLYNFEKRNLGSRLIKCLNLRINCLNKNK